MNIKDLRTGDSLSHSVALNALISGVAGAGKTPILASTSPNPVILLTEPGAMSLRGLKVAAYEAYTIARQEEFFSWWFGSDEAKRFDTLVWDSATQSAETYIEEGMTGTSASGKKRHGMELYGEMSRWMMGCILRLYFQSDKHFLLIAKQARAEENGVTFYRPTFPGKDLNVKIPHLFDLIACLGDYNIPGVLPSPTKAFRCRPSFDTMARDRSGNLEEFEPPNITHIIKKMLG